MLQRPTDSLTKLTSQTPRKNTPLRGRTVRGRRGILIVRNFLRAASELCVGILIYDVIDALTVQSSNNALHLLFFRAA